jgi:hypothetical protein
MHTTSLVLGLSALLSGAAQAAYTLETTYDSTNFFDEFNMFDGEDPTHGFVEYVDYQTASQDGLAGAKDGAIYMGVDSTTSNPANGRKSVRVESQKSWNHGLFISDIAHMPGSIAGVWPALWLFGPSWPASGEIDIIEGVNTQDKNTVTLHTSEGCSITNDGSMSSTTLKETDCNTDNAGTGCGMDTADNSNYGDGFNDIGGGVYAMEWTSQAISVWFFQRSSIPSDINSEKPDPSSWGQPVAKFNGGSGCDIDTHFKNQNLIVDTTFCGDWAGASEVWDNNAETKALADTCEDYVANNPSAFAEAYWSINSIKVYQQGASNYTSPYASRRSYIRKPYLA